MQFDPSRPPGPGQGAPLTAEYRALFEANLKDQAGGGPGLDRTYTCHDPGMPRVTNGYGQIEFVVTPKATHILIMHIHDNRRIFTDGRTWPQEIEPTFLGYSIGNWVDTDGDGNFDVLEVETRGFRGPRTYDASGIPLHEDNETIVKERIYVDKTDPDVIHDELTVLDHALTRPWTVMKSYRRVPDRQPEWHEANCYARIKLHRATYRKPLPFHVGIFGLVPCSAFGKRRAHRDEERDGADRVSVVHGRSPNAFHLYRSVACSATKPLRRNPSIRRRKRLRIVLYQQKANDAPPVRPGAY